MNAARRTARTPTHRTSRVAVAAASLICLATLAGCAPRGDFGRPAPSVIGGHALPFAGRVAAEARGEPAAWSILTDDERELRARAYRFLMPAHEWQVVERGLADLTRHRVTPAPLRLGMRRSYWDALIFSRGTSPAPLFRRIAQDADQDRMLIPLLREIALRVLEADDARLRFLLYVTVLEESQAEEAALRVAENRCLIAWVRAEARERALRYRYALERLAIEAPQRSAIEPERALAALDVEIATLDGLAVGELGACAEGIVAPPRRPAAGPLPAIVPAADAPPPDGVILFKR
ncbi:hypothetical protein [Salinarimonas rosea]|uniref:hypothetical protein n=1 Tax=Salinarimonas rosea TaxID=552063 RepID=UPI000693B6C9|nr:hypothetical protein [Salinarimonas rosea]